MLYIVLSVEEGQKAGGELFSDQVPLASYVLMDHEEYVTCLLCEEYLCCRAGTLSACHLSHQSRVEHAS